MEAGARRWAESTSWSTTPAPSRPVPTGFGSVTDEDWEASIALTLMAAVRTTRAALPEMIRRGGGSIITISSVNAYLPDPLVIDYSAAKAALTNFCKSLVEGGRAGRHPGQHDQPRTSGDRPLAGRPRGGPDRRPRRWLDPAEVAAQAAAGAVTGRFTRPPEIADLILMLASDRTGNVTGSDFAIDGGLVQTL